MQAIILAAGMGKRLKFLTQDNTKCMVKVNGITLIERMLRQLDKQYLSRIVIVIGYEGEKLVNYISTLNIKTPIQYINNSIYDKTNNIYSLALASEYLLKEDTLLLESDLIFEDSILNLLLKDDRPTLALVDKYQSWMDGTVVKIDNDDNILEFIPGKKFSFEDVPYYYKTVNIYKFSQNFSSTHYVPFLNAYSKALGNNEYYEQVLRVITMLDNPEIEVKRLNGQLWYEIDDIQDLDIASSMFTQDNNKKLELIQQRKGGYWRYPKILNYSEITNPFYPPKKLKDELKSNFETLLCNSPSSMEVNALLAAKYFGLKPEQIVIAGTPEELTSALEKTIADYKIYDKYDASLTYDTITVIETTPHSTLLKNNVNTLDTNIFLLINLSKSLNVHGINISVMISNNQKIIKLLKDSLPNRPLSSFAEFFMQIVEKYKNDYFNSINLLHDTKKSFEKELIKIKNINIIQTDTDYILLNINNYDPKTLAKDLLTKHNILVKLCDNNTHIQLSVKTAQENYKVLSALNSCLI